MTPGELGTTRAIRFSLFLAGRSFLLVLLCSGVAGCPKPAPRVRLDPIPLGAAVRAVNENRVRADCTLRASGAADGYFTIADGRRRRFHLDATMFFLAPRCLRWDLKKFGDRQVLLGSNDEHYWYFSKEDNEYFCGRHGVPGDLPEALPIRPDQVIDALGLGGIPEGVGVVCPDARQMESVPSDEGLPGSPSPTWGAVVQRVVDDYQQLLVIACDRRPGTPEPQGGPRLQKEYWIDRYAPGLIRRVVFRDADGVVEMLSELGRYARLSSDGPWLPYLIQVRWPEAGTRMDFRVGRWTALEQIERDSIQFATPGECDGH